MKIGDNEVKSIESSDEVYLRFVNKTKRNVSVLWVGYDGVPVEFQSLTPDTFLDVTTYVSHPWVFEDADTHDKLVVNSQQVFYPPSWSEIFRRRFPDPTTYQNIPPHRLIVMITLPVFSLRERCLQVVRDCIRVQDGMTNHKVNAMEDFKEVYLRFVNKTEKNVRVMWSRPHRGKQMMKLYEILTPGRCIDINTIVNPTLVGLHWVFEDNDTLDELVVNNKPVFYPPRRSKISQRQLPNAEVNMSPHRHIGMITLPVYSLRKRCLQVVRDSIGVEHCGKLSELNLPKSVQDDLREMILIKASCLTDNQRRSS